MHAYYATNNNSEVKSDTLTIPIINTNIPNKNGRIYDMNNLPIDYKTHTISKEWRKK